MRRTPRYIYLPVGCNESVTDVSYICKNSIQVIDETMQLRNADFMLCLYVFIFLFSIYQCSIKCNIPFCSKIIFLLAILNAIRD